MHTDTALTWVRRLCASLDAQFDAALPPCDDDVYTLVGLLQELDLALSRGARLPSAWAQGRAQLHPLGKQLVSEPPSNDTRRRRARSRARRLRSSAEQLSLPLRA